MIRGFSITLKSIALFVCLLAFQFIQSQTICSVIEAGVNDVEEHGLGIQYFDSSDIELVEDNTRGNQVIGLRFTTLNIPVGATIEEAHLQFTVDEVGSLPTTLQIKIVEEDNAQAFTGVAYDLSTRNTSSVSVSWTPDDWLTIGDAGPAQRSPDISSLIQLVVDRAGYNTGNAIIISISGSGKRVAESRDSGVANAPQLCVTFNTNNPCADGDDDADGVCNSADICPGFSDFVDTDNDGQPDGCDECIDINSNGVCDEEDPSLTKKVYINEINYRSPIHNENIDFVEIYNDDTEAIDISGWALSGAIDYTFPAGTVVNSGGYKVVAADPSQLQTSLAYAASIGPYLNQLNSSGETVYLRDEFYQAIDKVDYESWKEWPNVRSTDSIPTPISIQKIHPKLPGKHPGSWAAAAPNPGAQNSVYENNWTSIPVVERVRKSPDHPTSGEDMTIKVDIANMASIGGGLSVIVEYQVIHPGMYISKSDDAYDNGWISVQCTDEGTGADSLAGDGTYTASIPSTVQQHRRLIRYRVNISTLSGFSQTLPDQNHRESNYAYYVYDAYPNVFGHSLHGLPELPELTVITTNIMADTYIGDGESNTVQYEGDEYLGEGTVIYNGKIFDHIKFRPKGGGSRSARVKPGFKLDFNAEKRIHPVDNNGVEYDVERDKVAISGTWHNDPASHGLAESLCYKLVELCGGLYRKADYTHVRILDHANENGLNGDIWAINLLIENIDGELLEEQGLPDGNIWAYKPTQLDYEGEFPESETIGQWDKDESEYDLPLIMADRVANTLYGQNANNYTGKHSYREYYNPETATWHGWWGDLDNAYGSPFDDVVTFTRDDSNVNAPLNNALSIPDDNKIEYQNKMRSAYDLILNVEQSEFLIASQTRKVYDQTGNLDWVTVDHARWGQTYDTGSIDSQIEWYENWLMNRGAALAANAVFGFSDDQIPNTPSISLTGSNAIDNLTFSNSAFSDPDGNGTFASLEWRVGEWSDPSNPVYADKAHKFEVETKWTSGELSSYTSSFSIPASAELKVGRTYKIRVRYTDSSGRSSHWSPAVTVLTEEAINTVAPELVINELHYNPEKEHQAEFVELHNEGTTTVSLDNVEFTDGIEYKFDEGASIGPGEYLVLTDNLAKFEEQYGSIAFGEYKGSLSNSGEVLELRGDFDVLIDQVHFYDQAPWTDIPDQGNFSLALVPGTGIDNSLASNWSIQSVFYTPAAENNFVYEEPNATILINEIHYQPSAGDLAEFIEIVNTTENPIDLQGCSFVDGIYFDFDLPLTLPGIGDYPENYLVLAKDFASYQNSYGSAPYGTYAGKLNNNGELVVLRDASGNLLDQVNYSDNSPWDETASNGDHSLALTGFENNNDIYSSWGVQEELVTPGWRNFEPENLCPLDFTGDGLVNISDFLDLNSAYGISCSGCTYDLTGDGLVNVSDFLEFNTSFGLPCPSQLSGDLQQGALNPILENDLLLIDEKNIKPSLLKEINKLKGLVNDNGLVINEIHYNPKKWIVGLDTLAGDSLEFVEVKNVQGTEMDLTGVEFVEGINYSFPAGTTLGAGEFIVLAADQVSFQQRYGLAAFGEYDGQLSNNCDTLVIVDNANGGILCDQLIYKDSIPWETTPDEGYYSLGLYPTAANNDLPSSWDNQSLFFTPGEENVFDDWIDTDLVINEIHYNPFDTIVGMDTIKGDNFEFIEIKNIGSTDYDLSGALFSKGVEYSFADGSILPAGGMLVLAESTARFQLRYGFTPFGQYGGSLSNSGEKIRINAADGTTLDNVKYNDALPWDTQADGGNLDLSLALIDQTLDNDDGTNWKVQCTNLYTPGQENDVDCVPSPFAGVIKINEIHYNPTEGSDAEFIEIVNTGSAAIQLQGCAFVEGITFNFGLSTLLPGTGSYPDNYLVLAKNYAFHQFIHGAPPYSQYSDKLSNQGEQIVMHDADGLIIDVVAYNDNSPWDTVPDLGMHSLALLDINLDNDLPGNWSHQDEFLTPGSVNFTPVNNCPEDFTNDGIIDVSDFLNFNSAFGQTCNNCPADLTGDGTVDVSDFLEFNSAFGQTCPTQFTSDEYLSALHPSLDEILKQVDEAIIHPELLEKIQTLRHNLDAVVYPNPSQGEFIDLLIFDPERQENTTYVFEVLDLSGKTVLAERWASQGKANTRHNLQFNKALESGMYILTISTDNKRATSRFTVR